MRASPRIACGRAPVPPAPWSSCTGVAMPPPSWRSGWRRPGCRWTACGPCSISAAGRGGCSHTWRRWRRTPRCYGCDVDPNAIAWAARHRPELSWALSSSEPPLPYAEESFDLVYSISVFSHLDEALQDRWLHELSRILAPGGAALLSVHGSHALDEFRAGHATTSWCRSAAFARGSLSPGEFVFEPYARSLWNRSDLPGVGGRYGLTFHGGEYLRRHWSQWLEVVEVRERAISGWQDLVVCRRPVAAL